MPRTEAGHDGLPVSGKTALFGIDNFSIGNLILTKAGQDSGLKLNDEEAFELDRRPRAFAAPAERPDLR